MSNYIEIQRVRLKVQLKKIVMNIKFPCSLTAQIKHDTIHDCKKLYELKSGQCNMNEIIQSEVEVPFNTTRMRYEEKKIVINVFMVSVSGKVSAGSVNFTLFGKDPGVNIDSVQFLDKCPDKQAKIYFNFNFDQQRNKSERLDRTIISDLRLNDRKSGNLDDLKKKNNYNTMPIQETTRQTINQDMFSRYVRKSPSITKQPNLTQSQVEQVITLDRKEFKNNKNEMSMTIQQYMRDKNGEKKNQPRSKSRSVNKIRQANSNKNLTVQHSFIPITARMNTQFKQETEEVDRLRDKIKNLQKSDRNYVQSLRQTKEEAERKKNKINQLESVKIELQEAVKIKQEKIRKLQKTIKQVTQQQEEISNQLKISKNQAELKENIAKDQIKKVQQKYRQSEIEREKITQEYNRALKTYEQTEKKYQVIQKDKDRSMLEEKNKINRKIQQLNAVVTENQRQLKDLRTQNEQYSKEKKKMTDFTNQLQMNLESFKSIIESLEGKLKNEGDIIKQLENQTEVLRNQEQEKVQLKKKYNQLQFNNNTLTEKLNKYEKTIQNLQEKLKETEQEMQKRTVQKNQLNARCTQLKKNLDNIKFSEQQKTKQSQSLTIMHTNANSRINDLKNRLETERRSIEDMQRQFQSKYNILIHQKESIEAEAEDMKWQLQKSISTIQQLNQQIRYQNENIYKLNEQLIDKNQKIKKIQEANKILTTNQQYTNLSLQQNETKRKEQVNQIKDLNNQLTDVKKKWEKNQKQLFDLKQKLKLLQINNKQKNTELQKKMKEKDANILAKQNIIITLQQQIKQKGDELSLQKQTTMMIGQQLNHIRQISGNNKKQIDSQQGLIIKLKDNDNQHRRLIQQKDDLLERKNKQIDDVSKKLSKISEEYMIYRENSTKSIQSILTELIKDDQGVNLNNRNEFKSKIISHPDERITNFSLQVIQKRNQMIIKNKNKMLQNIQEKQNLEYQISKIKISLEEIQHSYQTDLSREKQKVRVLQVQVSKREQIQKQNIHKFQQTIAVKQSQIEQISSKMGKSSQQIQQLQAQIQIMIVQYESLKQENRQIEERLLKFKSSQIKEKAIVESKSKEIEENFEIELTKYRQMILDGEKKLMSNQKDILEKIEIIKKYQMEHNVQLYEKDKRENKIIELSEKIKDYQVQLKQYDKVYKEKERQIKKMSQNLDKLNSELRDEKQKNQDYAFKSQEQGHLIIDLNKQVDKLKQDLRIEQSRNLQNQNQFKTKFDNMKALNDKLLADLKQSREKNIALTSDMELKKFMIKQGEIAVNLQKESKEELKNQLQKRKTMINKVNTDLTQFQNKYQQLQEKLNQVQQQNQNLTNNLQRVKMMLNQSKNNVKDQSSYTDQINLLQRQVDKLRDQKAETEQYYERQLIDLKSMIKDTKKMQNSRSSREEDLRKKLKVLQKMLENGDNFDLIGERKKFLQQIDRERRDYLMKNDNLQSKNQSIQDELNTLKQRCKKQIQNLHKEIDDLSDELASKDFIIKNQQYQIDNLSIKIGQQNIEKNKIINDMEKEKAKLYKLQSDYQIEAKGLKEKMKKLQQGEMKLMMEEIDKKISRSRTRKLENNFNELQRMVVNSSYRQLQEILNDVVREKKY